MEPRKPYLTDVDDEEWSFAAPYLTLMVKQAPQRHHDLRELFNALRWLARAGAPWRLIPNHFPPWQTVYQQARRWLKAGCFDALIHDLRVVHGRMLSHNDGAGKEEGVGQWPELPGSPLCAVSLLAGGLDLSMFACGKHMAEKLQSLSPGQRCFNGAVLRHKPLTGEGCGIQGLIECRHGGPSDRSLELLQFAHSGLWFMCLPDAKKGFVLLPEHWIEPNGPAVASRLRRMARDCERLALTMRGLHELDRPPLADSSLNPLDGIRSSRRPLDP